MTIVVKKVTVGLITGLLAAGLLAGCTNTDTASSQADMSEDGVTTVEVASSTTSKPYVWLNDKGELTGYDVDVANAIDEKVPEIRLHWNPTEFQSIFLGIDSGKYTMGANRIIKNAEREKKYLYGDQTYLRTGYAIVYRPDRIQGTVNSLEDVVGKSISTFSDGSGVQLMLEGYNAKHPDNPLTLLRGDYSATDLLTSVENGQADATVVVDVTAQSYVKEHGTDLKIVELPPDQQAGQGGEAFFLFAKTPAGEYAKKAFDKGLQTIKDDGTLAKISIEHFGKDYTV